MMGAISVALIRRISARISETAPGRTPIAVARPPLVLPGFSRPRSIILISSMSLYFRISEKKAIPIFRNRLDFYFGISELAEMDPATAIIRKLGGEAKVAGIAGTALSAPYRWQHEKSRGGTGGLIPQAHHRRLLDYADAHGIALTAEEFLIPRAGGAPGAG